MIPIWLQMLLGGRPMVRVQRAYNKVNYYIDCYGRLWFARRSWSIFRSQSGMEHWERQTLAQHVRSESFYGQG
jgi:hypothetical protein